MRLLKLVPLAATMLLVGCQAPREYVRKGKPLPLAAGEPRTPCEEANFLELVPSHAKVERVHSYYGISRMTFLTGTAEANGLAAYKLGTDAPVLVEPILSSPGFEEALARHLKPMQPIRDQQKGAMILGLAGFGVMGAGGIMTALGAEERVRTGRTNYPMVIGALVGLGVGSIIAIVGLWSRPSPADEAELAIRERMFVRPDDDPEDAVKVVNAQNEQARRRCEAPPVASTPAQ